MRHDSELQQQNDALRAAVKDMRREMERIAVDISLSIFVFCVGFLACVGKVMHTLSHPLSPSQGGPGGPRERGSGDARRVGTDAVPRVPGHIDAPLREHVAELQQAIETLRGTARAEAATARDAQVCS